MGDAIDQSIDRFGHGQCAIKTTIDYKTGWQKEVTYTFIAFPNQIYYKKRNTAFGDNPFSDRRHPD